MKPPSVNALWRQALVDTGHDPDQPGDLGGEDTRQRYAELLRASRPQPPPRPGSYAPGGTRIPSCTQAKG